MAQIIAGTVLVFGLVAWIAMWCYRGYKALVKVQDCEIVLGENSSVVTGDNCNLEDTWMEAFDEVLKESV